MKYLISCVYFVVISMACLAQPYGDSKFKQKFNKADALTYDGAYMEALPLLEDMYAYDTLNANLNHLLGICYLMGKKDHDLAIKRLESASRDVAQPGTYQDANWKERKAPGITYYYLGKAYHFKNRFDRAVSNYYNYRSFIELDDVETYNQVRQQIQYAENAMELVKNPVGVKVMNLGPQINTKYPEYCPVVSADGRVLIFTSRREGGTSDVRDQDGQFYEDIYVCSKQPDGKWSPPKGIGTNINSVGHEAAIGLSPNGQLLFIYKDDNNDGNIYQSTLDGSSWTKPEPLGSDINTPAWETHATVNATEDMLIFVSNRSEGGYGGRDLWYCKKLPNGEWGLAMNMGSVINSQFEEDSPFISADGKTLIFSSQGHTSMGGFDIFRSEFVEGAWTNPENIGYPINTAEDDVFFTLTPDGLHAYYSSRMDGGYGETDLYRLRLEPRKTDQLAVARGVMKVPAMAYADISAKIIVTDEGGAPIGTYRPNPKTGYYVLILKPGETYTISYEADGYEAVTTQLPVENDEVYAEYDGVLELKEVVFGENILALQAETDKLNKEKEEAAARAAEEARLAEEAAAQAKLDAEKEALARAKEEERKKAEELAAKEKEEAAQQLAAEQEKARQAELDRKKAEAKAKFEAQQALAAEKVKAEAEEQARIEADRLKKEEEQTAQEEVVEDIVEEVVQEKVEEEIADNETANENDAAKAQAEQRAAEEAANAEAERKQAEEAAATKKLQEELAAKAAEEKAKKEQEQKKEAEALAKAAEQEQAASNSDKEAEAKRIAAAEAKRQELQKRIQELKEKQQQQEQTVAEVKEVTIQKMETAAQAVEVDTKAIEAKRQAMLERIEQLKKRKSEVEKQKVVDEEAVALAAKKEQEALKKKEDLLKKSEKTKVEINELQKELQVVEKEVEKVEKEVEVAKTEVVQAQEKVAADIAEEKRIAEEARKQEEEAKEAERQLKELAELERKRIEQEKIAAAEFEREQREEAERTKQELIQLEALAEQQRQVQVALAVEEEKKRKIEAAEKDAYSQEEILSNSQTLEQLRELNRQLIKDNLELKKQLVVLNAKLDLILQRMDYTPEVERVDIPTSSTMQNLQQGKRLILRNIFFDYNLATLRSRSKHELNKLFEFMKNNPTAKIQVSGHTDSRGDDDYNLRLSKDRAQAVVDYLVRNGISSSRLTAVGYGETRPIARNENEDLTDNPIGRQLNRRIEISLPEGAVDGVEVEEIDVPSGARID
jgi:outer membrane protein OmpA-like peptidoglycan-associated protein